MLVKKIFLMILPCRIYHSIFRLGRFEYHRVQDSFLLDIELQSLGLQRPVKQVEITLFFELR